MFSVGMNFYDFFIFLVRFTFANLVQLYHLTSSIVSVNFLVGSQRARNIAFNLEFVRDMALKMKSVGVEVIHGSTVDFTKMLKDATNLEFCSLLGRTYALIHDQCKVNYDMTQGGLMLFDFFESAGSRICTPDDLVSFINFTFTKLSLNAA